MRVVELEALFPQRPACIDQDRESIRCVADTAFGGTDDATAHGQVAAFGCVEAREPFSDADHESTLGRRLRERTLAPIERLRQHFDVTAVAVIAHADDHAAPDHLDIAGILVDGGLRRHVEARAFDQKRRRCRTSGQQGGERRRDQSSTSHSSRNCA